MDAISRNLDAASRYPGASGPGAATQANADAYRRNATAQTDTPEPADSQTTVTLSRRAQEMAAQDSPESSRRTGSNAPSEQADVNQMAQINAQLRRAYMGAEGPGGAG